MRLGKLLSIGEIVESTVTDEPPAPARPKPAEAERKVEARERPVPASTH
jgi:hypothetical protein